MLDDTLYIALQKEINELKTRLAVTDYFINNFEEQDTKALAKIEVLSEKITSLETKLYNDFKDVHRTIEINTTHLEAKVTKIQESIGSVAQNSFIQFTSELDIRKWIQIISVVASILLSVGVLDNYVSSSIDPSTSKIEKQLERLVELSK